MKNIVLDKIKKRRLIVGLILLFFVVNIAILYRTFSEKTTSTIWNGKIANKFASGDGSAAHPYIINDGMELAYFFDLINSDKSANYFNKFYEIRNNIDLNGYDFSFAKFSKTFSGSLNGNGFTISNFTISKYYLNDIGNEVNYSLFDSVFNASIKNINFKDITFVIDEIIDDNENKSNEEIEPEKDQEYNKVSLLIAENTTENENIETESHETSNKDDLNVNEEDNQNINLTDDNKEINTISSDKEENEEETSNSNSSLIENNVIDENNNMSNEENINIENNTENNSDDEENKNTTEVIDSNANNDISSDENTKPIDENEKTSPDENNVEITTKNEEPEEVKLEKINISLFKDVESSRINNITIDNVKINIKEKDLDVDSSLFILNDKTNNNIENISLSSNVNVLNSPLLIKNYNGSKVNNIVYRANELKLIYDYEISSNDNFYRYYYENEKITFKNDYSVNSILKLLNDNSDLKWKIDKDIFRILNNGRDEGKKRGAKRAIRTAPTGHASGIDGSIIYINDYVKDANYYQGLNYTYSSDGSVPTTADKNIYNDSNLVYVQVNYSGTNIEGTKTGEVSTTEHQSRFVYYKVYPVNNNGTSNDDTDDYIEIDLIDNPFASRPTDLVFQGWLTNYEGAEIILDTDVYVRRAKIPVTYTSNNPTNIEITFNAIWGNGVIRNYNSSWSNTFGYLAAAGFHPISSETITYDITGLYTYTYVSNNSNYPNGAVDANGQSLTGRCSAGWGGRCYYYIAATGTYNSRTDYYSLINGSMVLTGPNEIHNYSSEIPVGNIIAGYYRETTVPNSSSFAGYYNSSGNLLTSGTCNTNGGCTGYYELIQYYDVNNDPEVVTEGVIYYYKTTRDTNVVVLTSTFGGVWGSSQNKPFTFTGINNGTKYSAYWGLYYNRSSYTVTCYADTRIEHMNIYTEVSRQTNDATPSGNRSINGSNYNLKLGRGLKSSSGNGGNTSTSYVTFRYAAGAKLGTSGSSTGLDKYTFIVESGVYNNIAVVATSGTNNYYIYAHGTFGSDYDRIVENNNTTTSNLEVVYDLSGSFGGNIRSLNAKDVAIYTDIKSGIYGTNRYDVYTGVYFGSQISGAVYAARAGMVEGGYIYNLVGGPLSQSSLRNINDNMMYITGGVVDLVFGGAGVATTYGNKIVQVTGGQINYSVFAGSNGVKGSSSSKAQVDSDTYVYVGGNAVIGNPTYVNSSARESKSDVEAGSVFGIGNGRTGNGYDDIGSARNSYVVIDGNATVNFNVYGGGNYGGACRIGSNQTNVYVYGGTVKGSVYGGGNNNGGGTTNYTCDTNINMTGGTVEGSIYGGSRSKGIIYGSSNINITGGSILTDVYGGGEGGYEQVGNTTNPGTYILNNVAITIGNTTSGPSITGSVYGGSAYGTVNASTNNPSTNSKTVTVTVNNGTISDSVFGGAKGSSSITPYVPGLITVNINGGTITNVFGGFDEAGKPQNDPHVNIAGGTITNVYGGGNKTSVDNTHINMTGGTVTTMYGGSNQSGTVLTTDIKVSGGSAGTIYGGNNAGGTCSQTNIEITGGSINSAIYGGGNLVSTGTTNVDIYNVAGTIPNVYGGGNQAGATTTEVTLHKRSGNNNISITNVYGGSNQSGLVTTSNVSVEKGTITNIYGGGNNVGVTTTNVTLSNENSINVETIYGGSNQLGNVNESNVIINGGTVTTIYGANNAGGVTTETNVTINNGTITTVYGGGNVAQAGDTNVTVNSGSINTIFGGGNQAQVNNETNVTVNNASSTISYVYGGGNQAGATETNVTITPSSNSLNITNVFGGSNQSGNVGESNVTIEHGTITNLYGGNNAGGKTSVANTTVNNGAITNAYGGGNQAETDSPYITINNGTINVLYGGGNAADVNNNTNLQLLGGTVSTNVYGGGNEGEVDGNTNVTIDNATVSGSVFAGGNGSTATVSGNTVLSITDGDISDDIYGGGNNGVVIGNTTVTIEDSTVGGSAFAGGNGSSASVSGNTSINVSGTSITDDVYGGGNNGTVTGNTNVILDDVTVGGGVYAGGNGVNATVSQSTTLKIFDSTISHNIYGGGNNGTVLGSTNVLINDSNINGSAYAGGNGSTATVFGNTNIIIGGSSIIGTNACTVLSACSVFGGGNAANTGSQATDNSYANVKIAGATIYGNVYGGANTAKVFGATDVNIGNDVTLITGITSGNIVINGTVFGGGEANASGSDEYDWTFVSVTKGITVNINGANRTDFRILGSIFGSGNASTAAGTSTVTIKNYGTFNNPKRNISIQRTDLLTIDNSAIILVGATDRENEYSDVLFTLSRIDELDLKNNSTLFLETGANLLQEFKSLTSTGALATVTIDSEHGTVTKNVDNRVYMYIDKKLNIAKNQNITDYGEVSGMSFFGMYKYNSNNTINTGIYGKYNYDDILDWGGVFDNVSSYVLGLHKTNHNITVDGFYTNYIDEETSQNKINYIEPTPPSGDLYMWTIGVGVIEYEVDLAASKYSTLGTTELPLRDFTDPNTSFQILGFDYSELDQNIQLVEKNTIKKIADTNQQADTIMGLSMETSNTGWLTNGYTSFLTNANNQIIGTREYVGGNNTITPTVLFYLHHSKNISSSGNLGKVRIQLMSIRQIDALTKETRRLIITVNLSRTLFDTVNYEGAMTPGRKYDLFTSTATNITSSSSISVYYSLFNNGSSIYRTGYHRALVSNYVLPLNTKITMIDLSKNNPEYYYHIINATDVANATYQINNNTDSLAAYNLSLFEVMGALNSGVYYNDATKNSEYCNGSYCNEDFIFIVDFGDTTINSDALGNQMLMEIRNSTDDTIYSVLAPQHMDLIYNVYVNKDAVIDMNGSIDRNKIYSGESLIADMQINYTQSTVGSTTIYDTHYFDSKLGIKISILNSNDEVLSGATLLGLFYEIDGVQYFPNIDGTTRIKLADKVDSAEKWIIVNTGTSKIASGNYKLKFESFGSPDGIYYGLNSSDTQTFNIEIVNEIYGLDIRTSAEEMIIDGETGLNVNGDDTIVYNVRYNSGLTSPKIYMKMYRRNYTQMYDTNYTLVNAQNYFDNAFASGYSTNEYVIMANPSDNSTFTLRLKDNLITGTYKLEFLLYEDHSVIGTVERYIIIK